MPILEALRLLEQARLNGADLALGLRAALSLEPGDLGAVEYALRSDETVVRSLQTVARYASLLSEALSVGYEVRAERVQVQIQSAVRLPRFAHEFLVASLLNVQTSAWPADLRSTLEVWLPTARVAPTEDYRRVFGPVQLHFDSVFVGFAFAARHLEDLVETRDVKLNGVVHRHLELEHGRLRKNTHAERVRALLVRELPSGGATAKRIARLLRTSVSTLGRRLEAEGTSFAALREEQRRSLALGYLSATELSVAEIAELAGFSHVTAFRRAFKRWTGKPPQHYREEQHSSFVATRNSLERVP
ncbi:MAG TPA: AraC family transcriptional regulator ligand-binding domain-containing protein, partial [Polyangiales bacterium]|nr:AraC family transcriptional regulator ligand-binding domain-containing protein [Polyangiales bacterium]